MLPKNDNCCLKNPRKMMRNILTTLPQLVKIYLGVCVTEKLFSFFVFGSSRTTRRKAEVTREDL